MASKRCSLVAIALLALICWSAVPFLSFVGTGSFSSTLHEQPVWSHAKFKLCQETFLDKLCKHAATLPLAEGNELLVSFLWSFGTLRWVRLTRVARRAEGDSTNDYELWVDFRMQRLRKPATTYAIGCGKVSMSNAAASLQSPKVKEGLLNLARTLREKFNKIGVELPKGKLVNGVIVDKKFAQEVLEEVKGLQIPVYTACKEVDGEKMQGNSCFVCKAADGEPVACLAPKQVRLSSTQPQAAEDVYGFEEEETKAERDKEEADAMKRYEEGLKDPEKYVLPPRKRMRELFGLPPEPRKPDKSQLMAKTLPPDALLWGRALMDRQRTGKVGYNLKSDAADPAKAVAAARVLDV